MQIKHILLFSILCLIFLMSAAVCTAKDLSLGFSQDLFMPVFLSFDGITDDAELQYTPAENANEDAILKLSEKTQVKLLMTDGASGPEVREVELTSRIRVKPREGEKEDFDHHMTACLRTVAALTGWKATDNELQSFLDEISEAGYAEKETLRGVYKEEDPGSHYIAKFRLMNISADFNDSSDPTYDPAAYKAFDETLSSLKQDGKIPSNKSYEILNTDDFTDEWAMMDTLHWQSFTSAKNFVITAEISWTSAYELPNTANGGCGFVFRETGEEEHMMVSLRMDGFQYLTGKHNLIELSYPKGFYALPEISGTHQLTVAVNEERVEVYLDGVLLNSYYGAAIMTEGNLGFATLAGTNYDYGTHCEFKNIFYTIW